ncbi:hypothetical protein [Luteolibacter soli]|uniref:J domain-containing protein n=1 Tax=Luteolibacter soli TaxID=3135280 RepID=A0ABU9AR98_9BACT
MPWTTLGLDPAGATERDVKRAYAKLLKTCRPDQDPEGFRKLHDAYQAALYEVEWRGDDGDDRGDAGEGHPGTASSEIFRLPTFDAPVAREEGDVADEPASEDTSWGASGTFGSSPGLQAIIDCFDRLESAFANGGNGIPGLVEQVETLLYEHPSEVIRWGGLMQEVFARHGDHPELVLKADTILFELEHGGASATLAVVERLDRRGDSEGIANLANLLLQNKGRIATSAAGIATARLAGATAFWAKGRTERLADFAYQHLARGERDFQMQLIDRHVAMATMLVLVPANLKSFWRQRLIRPAGRDDWEDEESKAAIGWLKTPMAGRGPCFDTLVGLLPADIAAPVKAAAAKRMAPDWEEAAPGKKATKWERSSSSGYGINPPGWSWILIGIFAVRILLFCASQTSSPPSPSPRLNFPSSPGQYDPETQRRIKEGAERVRELREKRERSKDAVPSPPSLVPSPKLTPDQEQPENPLLKQFQSGNH